MPDISIDYGRAEDDATTINRLTARLDETFDNLVSTYEKEAANGGMEVEWAETLKQNLKRYRENEMTEATTDMNKSASNIRNVAEEVNKYSNEAR